MRSTAMRWYFRGYRLHFTLQLLSLPTGTVLIQGFTPWTTPELKHLQRPCFPFRQAFRSKMLV
jgi:hypothetical protein